MMSIRSAVVLAGLFAFAGSGFAGEKKLMHCFAFTEIDDASKEADWDAFFEATDELPDKIDGPQQGLVRQAAPTAAPIRSRG